MSHPHASKAPHGHGHPGGHPGGEKKYLPRLIAWEVTRSCVLNCIHCRAAARQWTQFRTQLRVVSHAISRGRYFFSPPGPAG